METLHLYNVKTNGGGGPKILLCKDRELIAEKVWYFTNEFRQKSAVKIEGEGVSSAIFTSQR